LDMHTAQLSFEQLPSRSVDADGLRCLDATHPADCTRCARAPFHCPPCLARSRASSARCSAQRACDVISGAPALPTPCAPARP
jgi:hypothetical protein